MLGSYMRVFTVFAIIVIADKILVASFATFANISDLSTAYIFDLLCLIFLLNCYSCNICDSRKRAFSAFYFSQSFLKHSDSGSFMIHS